MGNKTNHTDHWPFLSEYCAAVQEMCTSMTQNANNALFQNMVAALFANGDQKKSKVDWLQWYEEHLKQYLKVPSIGMTRQYQEKMNAALDTFAVFQGTISEFMALLFEPVQNSLKSIQDQMPESASGKTFTGNTSDCYGAWVKAMETEYQNLFNAREYIQSLGRTITAFNDFMQARRFVLEDALKLLPVPTTTEMDDLYKDMYHLKKRLRILEKKVLEREG